MKLILPIILLSLADLVRSKGCSEAMRAITKCVARQCPDKTQQCGIMQDADNCAQVQEMCSEIVECCGGCNFETTLLLATCTPDGEGEIGGVCDIATCQAEAQTAGAGGLCSEAIEFLTECVIQTCPDEQECRNFQDADTCGDVQGICSDFVTCCNGCNTETTALLAACTPGVGGICDISTCQQEAEQASTLSGVSMKFQAFAVWVVSIIAFGMAGTI